MILWVVLTSFSRYVDMLFKVMFHFKYHLLTLEKQFGSICFIVISGVTYCLVVGILAI
jgi:hypothetical protein